MRTLLSHEQDCVGKTVEDVDYNWCSVVVKFTDGTVFVLSIVGHDDGDVDVDIVTEVTDSVAEELDLWSNEQEKLQYVEAALAQRQKEFYEMKIRELVKLSEEYPKQFMEIADGLRDRSGNGAGAGVSEEEGGETQGGRGAS